MLLERLIAGMDVDAGPFAVCRVGTGACMTVPESEDVTVHYVLTGRCALTCRGGRTIDLARGAMILLPGNTTHEIAMVGQGGGMPPVLGSDRLRRQGVRVFESGWRGAGVVLVCGLVRATYHGVANLFEHLPAPIVEQPRVGDAIYNAFATLVHELADPQPGAIDMTAMLMRQCLLAVLRKRAEGGICNAPWLSALDHPGIGRALREVLSDPGRPCTLDFMAGKAGMSRSAFSKHFAQMFGRTPMDFVKEIRLRRAAELLLTTRRPIKSIASDVGYHSRSHFSRAFKQTHGLHPAAYREQGSLSPASSAL